MPRALAPPKHENPSWRLLAAPDCVGRSLAAGLALGAPRGCDSFLLRDPRFGLRESGDPRHGLRESRARAGRIRARLRAQRVSAFRLAERRRHLLAVDWVSTASVTRVWPNRIVVIVTERTPGGIREAADLDGEPRATGWR